MKVVQLLPDGHRMKKEVDMALDTVSETMTPMHYHLREIIICTYRQVSPLFPSAPGNSRGTRPAKAGSFLGLRLSGVSPEMCQGSRGHGHCLASCAFPHPTQSPACNPTPIPSSIPLLQHPFRAVRCSQQRAGLVCPAQLPAQRLLWLLPSLGRRLSPGKGSRP